MKFKAVNKNTQFIRAYKRGFCHISPLVVVYAVKNRYGHTRIGITASKKVGCAVKRNRARRVIRRAVQNTPIDFSKGWDLIFVARGKTTRAKSWQIQPVIQRRLIQAGVMADEQQ